MSKTNKKAVNVQPMTASETNGGKCTSCPCGKQATLFEIPMETAQAGTVVEHLLTHSARARQDHLASIFQTDRRGIRKQSQEAGGAVLFFSQTKNGGLIHIVHANAVEFRLYTAEMKNRIQSLQDRLNSSIALWLAMGRTL